SIAFFAGGFVVAILLAGTWFLISEKRYVGLRSSFDPATAIPVSQNGTYQIMQTRIHGTRTDGIENDMNTVLRIDSSPGSTWELLTDPQHNAERWIEITDDPLLPRRK